LVKKPIYKQAHPARHIPSVVIISAGYYYR
jgi:hypothetical protein